MAKVGRGVQVSQAVESKGRQNRQQNEYYKWKKICFSTLKKKQLNYWEK